MSAFRPLRSAIGPAYRGPGRHRHIITSPGRAQQPARCAGNLPDEASGAPRVPNPTQSDDAASGRRDRQNMMDQLHIATLRRGADGNNKQSPFYANYDESKANPYPTLPDPLVMNNGKKVTTAAMWPARRAEIKEMFDREIYGRVPAVTPKVTWQVIKTVNEKNGDVPVITKTIVGHVDNSAYPAITVDIQLSLSTPTNATGPVPVMMYLGGNAPGFPGPTFGFPGGRGGSRSVWRVRDVVASVRIRRFRRRPRPWAHGSFLATAGSGEGLGLRDNRHQQHSG